MRMCAALLIFCCTSIAALSNDYQLFYENGKTGLRDQSGKIILPASFDALGWSDGSFSVINEVTGYRKNSNWGLINLKKELITKANFENLVGTGGDRIIASKWINPFTKKFGCINLEGKETVPFHYDGITIRGLRAIVVVKNGTRYEYGLIDLNNRSILPVRYREIRPIGTLRLAVQNFERKTALFSEEGIALTDFSIDSISQFKKGKAIVYQNFKQGIINREGIFDQEPVYREVRIADTGEPEVKGFNEWIIIDETNTVLKTAQFDHLSIDQNVYRARLCNLSGTVSKDLEVVLPLQFNYLSAFQNNMAAIQKNGKYGVIYSTGKELIPATFDSVVIENNFIRTCSRQFGIESWSVYDTFGIRKNEKTYPFIDSYNGKFFPITMREFAGGMDRYGKEIISVVYDSITGFNRDLISVKFKGQYGIINYSEKWLVTPQPHKLILVNEQLYLEKHDSITFLKSIDGKTIYFTNRQVVVAKDHLQEITPLGTKQISWQGMPVHASPTVGLPENTEKVFEESEGYRGIYRDGRYGFIDARGRLRVANRYEGIGRFKQHVAPVKILGKWGFVNKEDRVVINPNYEEVSEFEDGVSIVRRNGKAGFIDTNGKVLLDFRYDSIYRRGNYFEIVQHSKHGLSDNKGNVLIEPRFNELEILANGFIKARIDEHWGVLTHDGLSVLPTIYHSIAYDAEKKHYLVLQKSDWKKLAN